LSALSVGLSRASLSRAADVASHPFSSWRSKCVGNALTHGHVIDELRICAWPPLNQYHHQYGGKDQPPIIRLRESNRWSKSRWNRTAFMPQKCPLASLFPRA